MRVISLTLISSVEILSCCPTGQCYWLQRTVLDYVLCTCLVPMNKSVACCTGYLMRVPSTEVRQQICVTLASFYSKSSKHQEVQSKSCMEERCSVCRITYFSRVYWVNLTFLTVILSTFKGIVLMTFLSLIYPDMLLLDWWLLTIYNTCLPDRQRWSILKQSVLKSMRNDYFCIT